MAGKQRAVEQLYDGRVIKEYGSIRDAARGLGREKKTDTQHIIDVCRGRRRSAYGYTWRYKGNSCEG